jgi:diguanylate cyclase (GGDEF)-like protein/PAS domain S-box-containing protein
MPYRPPTGRHTRITPVVVQVWRNRRLRRDTIIGAVLLVASIIISHQLDLFEHVVEWTRKYEDWQIDELSVVFVWVAIYAGIISSRVTREFAREVRQRESAERHLRESEVHFSKLFSGSPYPIFVTTHDGTVVIDANEEFERTFGLRRSEVIGRTERTLGLWATPDFETGLRQMLRRDGRLRNVETLVRDGSGGTRTVLVSAEVLDDQKGDSVIVALNDITERKRLEEHLEHQAFHDQLTGLANRALFRDRVTHALARAARHRRTPAILFLDLDDFKRVNDSLGHNAGDELLRAVAQRLDTCVRTSDSCARLGGDEFAILLEDASCLDDAIRLAERIVPLLRSAFRLKDGIAHVGVSIGIAVSEGNTTADELLRDADLAMYLSKSGGKGRFTVFEKSMHAEVVRRTAMESDLRVALERNQFEIHYQPIVSISNGDVIGIEALLRWNHPERGRVAPGEFIPIAEESGVINDIGRWVLASACRECQTLTTQHPRPVALSLAVNLSGRQIQSPTLVADVREALEGSGLPPEQLVLEITESVLVHNDQETLDRLWELKRLGIQLAIDDFGTGYSSLAYLQRFPVDILKIDKSFTDRLGAGPDESPLSRAVVALGSTLSVRTIAEGVETRAQWERLRDLGCELGQGFLFARPMDGRDLQGLIASGARAEAAEEEVAHTEGPSAS